MIIYLDGLTISDINIYGYIISYSNIIIFNSYGIITYNISPTLILVTI